ncbi:MAG TPA: ABC transporter permease [Blastocatellia bacterium]|nr:ABC transporter permease [Blastocatellia bacterium]
MSELRLVLEVARWEFRRFFKIKDFIVSLLVLAFIAGAVWGGAWLMWGKAERARIAIVNAEILALGVSPDPGFEFVNSQSEDQAALRESIAKAELDGLLIIKSVDEAELVVSREVLWQAKLADLLTSARLRVRLAEAKLQSSEFAELQKPVTVSTTYATPGNISTTTERAYAAGLIGVMMLAIASCYMYQFTAITGEKHLHVTEQIVSAISPQVWMDGKIIGISVLGVVTVLIYGGLAFGASVLLFWLSGLDFMHLLVLVRPSLMISLLTLVLLGILFWNCFFAAIAATIDDPVTSSRGVYMFLSFLPVTFAAGAITTPDSTLMKALGLFPVTSPAVLSVRLVRTEVAAWEILVAVVLLVGSIWALRWTAGKIFRVAMLMYGKEPGLAEIGRWLREA